MSDLDEATTIPILLLGDPGCGKSAFLSRILSPPAISSPPPPLRLLDQPYLLPLFTPKSRLSSGDDSHNYTLELCDTSSPTSYTILHPRLILLCFDISDRRTLTSLASRWAKELHLHFEDEATGEVPPVMVLGLKRDLRGNGDAEGEEGWIYPEEGHGMATRLRCDAYVECSALTGELVGEVVRDLGKMAVKTVAGGEAGGRSPGPSCGLM